MTRMVEPREISEETMRQVMAGESHYHALEGGGGLRLWAESGGFSLTPVTEKGTLKVPERPVGSGAPVTPL